LGAPYALTDLGRDLLSPVQALADWVIANSARIDATRAAYAIRQASAGSANR
jgi:DNA-binding HxlR family transcriptional regulator